MSDRIGCRHCNFKGYVKYSVFNGADDSEEGSLSVSVCSHCKDTRGYYAYVRNKYGSLKNNLVNLVEEESTATLLDFNEFKSKNNVCNVLLK